MKSMDYEKLFIELMQLIKENYSYMCFKKVDMRELLNKSGEFKGVKSEGEFIQKLIKVLSVFKDVHLYIKNSKGRAFGTFKRIYEKNYDSKVVEKYFTKELFKTSISKACLIKDIFYVEIGTWVKGKREEIIKTLKFLEKEIGKHEKIIIDVRANKGGADSFALKLVSYLVPKNERLPIAIYKYRIDKKEPCKLGKEKVREVVGEGENKNAKVCVLIGKACVSSNETFIMGMKNLKNSVIIGDFSYGSSGNPKEFKRGGITLGVPSWISYQTNGEILEEKGIKPDTLIKSNNTIVKNRDRALEKAIEVLEKK